jgi:hypothetical protein
MDLVIVNDVFKELMIFPPLLARLQIATWELNDLSHQKESGYYLLLITSQFHQPFQSQ